MCVIIPDIHSLEKYNLIREQKPVILRPAPCGQCLRELHSHGTYSRKADRSGDMPSLNPILIQRYYCPQCCKTCSVLPECIPPHRWYLWSTQQACIQQYLQGIPFRAIARGALPSRHTLSRWCRRLREQFNTHAAHLRALCANLGRAQSVIDFWQQCLARVRLSTAMRSLHINGVRIP